MYRGRGRLKGTPFFGTVMVILFLVSTMVWSENQGLSNLMVYPCLCIYIYTQLTVFKSYPFIESCSLLKIAVLLVKLYGSEKNMSLTRHEVG